MCVVLPRLFSASSQFVKALLILTNLFNFALRLARRLKSLAGSLYLSFASGAGSIVESKGLTSSVEIVSTSRFTPDSVRKGFVVRVRLE
jgi:hypothetical protein